MGDRTGPATADRVHPETRTEWRAWLEEHHASSQGVWLVGWKASTGRARLTYEASVEEALAFGWIDSKGQGLDEERAMVWMSPRKRGSGWARTNKERVERLEREGRMTAAGRAVIERAKADGSWSLFDSVEDLVVPDDLAAAFADRPGSRERWEAFPKSVRRANLAWLVQARRDQTRRRRIGTIADLAARGERANP
jgi:uncharacterized protein YdeI (YjbR/CyaY-like superfamily)